MALVLSLSWKQLPDIPDPKGLAGCIAGVSHGTLLVAGGSNFPVKPPWEGGAKKWYRRIYKLQSMSGQWEVAGNLPHNVAYGVSVSWKNKFIWAGGSDENQHYRDCYSVELIKGRMALKNLPLLPVPVANGCGAVVGHTLYVVGGQQSPTSLALNTIFSLNLYHPERGWQTIRDFPGEGRILATAADFDGKLWVVGGAGLYKDMAGNLQRTYLRDGYSYDPHEGWKRIADLPYTEVAAPSPAPTDLTGFLVLGGDDGTGVGTPMEKRHGFLTEILRFDAPTNRWVKAGQVPAGRVTAPTALWRNHWVIINGEMRPGVRSPEVWAARITEAEPHISPKPKDSPSKKG